MIDDAALYRRAKAVLNPRQLSPSADAGGVGCALVTAGGNVYVGVCIDTGSSMGYCAEHNAIGTMITQGESQIVSIVAVRYDGRVLPPCGRCREFIYQVNPSNAETRVLLEPEPDDSGFRVKTLSVLLPECT